jgi:putative flippase GtrA
MKNSRMAYLRKALKSRTVWLGAIVTILSTFQGLVSEMPVPYYVQGIIGSVLGILIILLRLDTKDGIADK